MSGGAEKLFTKILYLSDLWGSSQRAWVVLGSVWTSAPVQRVRRTISIQTVRDHARFMMNVKYLTVQIPLTCNVFFTVRFRAVSIIISKRYVDPLWDWRSSRGLRWDDEWVKSRGLQVNHRAYSEFSQGVVDAPRHYTCVNMVTLTNRRRVGIYP